MKRTWALIITGCCLLAGLFCIGIGTLIKNDIFQGLALFFMVACFIAGYFASRCPHCGYWCRHGLFNNYCPHCGEPLD